MAVVVRRRRAWKLRAFFFLLAAQEEEKAAMAKRLLPSLNRVLVEKLVQPKKTAGGILLPETSKQVLARLAHPVPVFATAGWSRLVDCVSVNFVCGMLYHGIGQSFPHRDLPN